MEKGTSAHRERALADDDQRRIHEGDALRRCLQSLRLGRQSSAVGDDFLRRDLGHHTGAADSQCADNGLENGKLHFYGGLRRVGGTQDEIEMRAKSRSNRCNDVVRSDTPGRGGCPMLYTYMYLLQPTTSGHCIRTAS